MRRSVGAQTVELDNSVLSVDALPVTHGPVPAVAYAVTVREYRIVFAGDHDGRGDGLARFARDADLLVMHMPIPEDAGSAARALHATPSRIGEIAAAAGAKNLLLSHFMARSLIALDDNLDALRRRFDGRVSLASDLACMTLEDPSV